MARYIPDDRDGLDRLVAQLVELFGSAERRLLAAVALQLRAGLDAGADSPARALRLGELNRDAQTIVTWLTQQYPDVVDTILETAAERGATAALAELPEAGGRVVEDLTSPRNLPGLGAVVALTADLSNTLSNVTERVLRYPRDVYQRAIAFAAPDVLLGFGTTRTAQQAAWGSLLRGGVTGFTDVRGRRWALSSYVEMATRSATRRAYDDSKVTTMQNHGINLVSVVVGAGSCKACADWVGKILRTDAGPVGRIRVPNLAGDGDVTVTVAGTLDDAKRHGWRHPNCRCSTVAYLPGLSVITDVTHYDPDAEAARQKLRYLEREVRAAKVEASADVGDGKTAANARVRALQAKIRDHIAETGLIRQRHREQPNLGNVA